MTKFFKVFLFYIMILIVVVLGLRMFDIQPINNNVPISEVITSLEKGQVRKIEISGKNLSITTNKNEVYSSYLPTSLNNSFSELLVEAKKNNSHLIVEGIPESETSWIINILPTIIMMGIMIYFIYSITRQSQGGGNKMNNFGKSRAKLNKSEETKVKFDDVAGLVEEKEELREIVDFLKNPKKYIDLGARIPKGVLLIGPPGTGKTYLSKAVAGEANVPFFSISGSDFVEMFVGVGASRVRDLFSEAKKASPCIVFIDEIDAVGRKRGAGLGGGHDEREQTLNQLLVEMDGFGVNQGIIIIAATNRPDILDPALLRPGRFDREIFVSLPDLKGREEIIKVHSKNKPLANDLNISILAKRTTGFSPADIENIMNEASILTARQNKSEIDMKTVEEAITKVIAGIPKKSRVLTEKEKKLTAYHEAGHAIVATVLPNSDPVHQVTITPRGRAGGFTMQIPLEDTNYMTRTQMKEELSILLAGRISESLVLDDISTGAQNDLQRVARISRDMVTKYAFSDNLPAMSYVDTSDEVFLGRDFASKKHHSEEISSKIDKEIEDIVEKAYEKTETILKENIDRLHYVAKALLKYETLNESMYKEAFDMVLDIDESIS